MVYFVLLSDSSNHYYSVYFSLHKSAQVICSVLNSENVAFVGPFNILYSIQDNLRHII